MVTTRRPRPCGADQAPRPARLSADAWKRFSDEGFKHYEVVEPGFKYNMMDLQAALGLHQLARVEENLGRRQAIWATVRRGVRGSPGLRARRREAPGRGTPATCTRSCSTSTGSSASRDEVPLRAPPREHRDRRPLPGPPPSSVLPGHVRLCPGDFPNAEWISERTLSLPLRRSWRTRTSRVSSPPSSERWRTWAA